MKYIVLAALLVGACADSDSAAPAVEPRVADFSVSIRNIAAADALVTAAGDEVDVALSPGVWTIDAPEQRLFDPGIAATPGLELLAESGVPSELLVEAQARFSEARSFGGDSSSSYGDQPIMPGTRVDFGFRATEGQSLSLATMFGQSNDVIVATDGAWPLFDEAGEPFVGRIVLVYFDVGTEVNEEPGAGPNQAPRQQNTDDGEAEDEVITAFETEDRSGFVYPVLMSTVVLEVTEATVVESAE